ncbi:unnamed protein product [Bursaphelenchus xylophilus]|uniref:(pine wood nematode) hypothetical protein n=1 Tax=Bursaphelenchus xylophilus TaxID=6326 RepID=A0A1I7RWA5_BURXY|nr:unnamed protein product [Bursaphelenchus xylophilus]CAG9095367.1 unnamed protein product [Bursaphelenchus xylophilus]
MLGFSKLRFLDFVAPFCKLVPSIAIPQREVKFGEKLIWTLLSLFVYLVYCQVPLYGIEHGDSEDPLYFLRLMMASNHGTLMELGITPTLTSSMIMQLMASTGIIQVDGTRKDLILLSRAQRLVALLFLWGQATLYVFSGIYGSPFELGLVNCSLIVLQLAMSGLIMMLLDDMMQSGYGLGSGTNLFIATNLCEMIVWKAFSPLVISAGNGKKFEGAVLELVKLLIDKEEKFQAFEEVLLRKGLPNLMSLGWTMVLFFLIAYLQAFQLEIPLVSANSRGQTGVFPIRLAHTSNMGVFIQNALVSNILTISKLLSVNFSGYFIVDFIGVWETMESGRNEPTWGISYYLTSVNTLEEFQKDPFRAVVNVTFTLLSCTYFSVIWLRFSGKSAKDIVEKMKREKLMVGGHRHSSMTKYLNQYIQTAAALGGIGIGVLSILAEILGVIGSGASILMTVNVICSYYDAFEKENADESKKKVISPQKIGRK